MDGLFYFLLSVGFFQNAGGSPLDKYNYPIILDKLLIIYNLNDYLKLLKYLIKP